MPQPARDTYHHGNLRAALVEAGLELTRAGGPGALLLRDVTRRAGVSPSAAYRHFADRDELLHAIAERIQDDMAARMRDSSVLSGLSGRDRLRAVGLGYIGFALRETGWFETAFFTSNALPGESGMPTPLAALVDALDAMVREGELSPSARRGAEWPCWSAVHGFALLALHGPPPAWATPSVRMPRLASSTPRSAASAPENPRPQEASRGRHRRRARRSVTNGRPAGAFVTDSRPRARRAPRDPSRTAASPVHS